jgi:DNA-binding IclR family transcriptional regulator
MSADGRAEESPQQGFQSIEVRAQVLRALEKLLVKTRRDGIASSLHRMIYGMAAFGAPVFGPDRGLVLAIGLAMPARPPACWSRA